MGGKVEIPKICNQCNNCYMGNPNQHLCYDCKVLGYKKECKHCNIQYYAKYAATVYCLDCTKKAVWITPDIINNPIRLEKISNAVKAYAASPAGRAAYAKLGKYNRHKMLAFNKTTKGKANIEKIRINNSKFMLDAIASGRFTPNITNSWTHWEAIIELDNKKTKRFRSSWEACFWMSNQHLEYESYRIPYIDTTGKSRTYVADFFCETTNSIFEIKPISQYKNQSTKISAAINYCQKHQIKFMWINENNILNYIDKSLFSNTTNKEQLQKLLNGINKNTD